MAVLLSERGKETVGWQYVLTPFHRVRRKKVNSPCIHFLTRSKRTNSFHPRFSSFEERLFFFFFFSPLLFFFFFLHRFLLSAKAEEWLDARGARTGLESSVLVL